MKRFLGLTASLLVLFLGFEAPAQTISEETTPVSCGRNLVAGITCRGGYCDNITPICGGFNQDVYDIRWSQFVSEENGGEVSCNVTNPFERGDWPAGEPAFIAGFACNGSYCDNIALECVALRNAFPESYGGPSCNWTGWVSEETPTLRFPPGQAAVRMQCRGRYCDDKRFLVCPVRAR